MELIKLTDYEGTSHYINKRYIISVRPFYSMDSRIRKSKVEYGSGFVDCIYMKEPVNIIASMIAKEYLQ